MSAHRTGHRSHASGRRWMAAGQNAKKGRLVEQAKRMEVKMTEQPDRCPTCGSDSGPQVIIGFTMQHAGWCPDPFHRPPRKEPT